MVGLRNVKTVAETPKQFYHLRKRTQSAPTYTYTLPLLYLRLVVVCLPAVPSFSVAEGERGCRCDEASCLA